MTPCIGTGQTVRSGLRWEEGELTILSEVWLSGENRVYILSLLLRHQNYVSALAYFVKHFELVFLLI